MFQFPRPERAASAGSRVPRCCLGVVLLAASAGAATSAAPQVTASPHPNIVLITLDTTRADRMGFLGSVRGLTPNLDELARRSLFFARAYAQVPLTTPSHAAILTGTYPRFNHVNYMGDPLGDALPFLPEILHKNGYRTAAFVGALVLDPRKLAPGFQRGFDTYDAGFHRRRGSEDRYRSLERRGEEVVNRALGWLSKQPAGPFFLWVHLYDPHDPYSPPEPYKTRYQSEPYDGEIAYTDSVVGRLTTGLRTRGLFDSTLLAVMADHGEAFGEHGENHHGIFLYDETIHVPLLFKLPGQHSSRKVEAGVGLVDVAPTILEAAHLPVPPAMQGESVLRFMKLGQAVAANQPSDSNLQRGVYAESGYGHLSFGWSTLRSWRIGKYLYIEAPERELYDQSADPLAAHNLAPDSKAVADTAAAQIAEFYRKTKGAAAENTKLSAEQNESLHALGYLSSDFGISNEADDGAGPDPKAKIGIANLLYEALVDVEQERYQEAVPILEQVLKQEPNTPIAFLQLGRAYMSLKEYQKAVTPLQSLVEKKPDDAFARYELGCALVKTGNWDEALPHFEAAVSQMTGSAMMHFYLALVYQRNSRMDEATKEFQNALRLDPNNFPANLLLGRLFVMQQRATDALPHLRKAATLRPDSIDAHRFLADVYAELGQQENSRRELTEAERLRSQGGSRLGTPADDPGGLRNQP
jgi:arylsulfatase A-like enzyme/Tfp pilus assembly protein PilF